jgi:cyclopropane-fatty-acyl-phospholipid synthase
MAARARLADGERILELGCGWSSLSVRMAQRLPNSNITAVSNPRNAEAVHRGARRCPGLTYLEVITADMNAPAFPGAPRSSRVVSGEMFERMARYFFTGGVMRAGSTTSAPARPAREHGRPAT